jgi:hypothetical protein
LPQVVPWSFDGKGRIEQDLLHDCLYFANGTPEPLPDGPAWPAYLEIVGHKLLADVGSKNLGPGFAPDSFCKCIVI